MSAGRADFRIDRLARGDWPAVAEIYREGILTRTATFETSVPSWDEWDAAHLQHCRLVARGSGLATSADRVSGADGVSGVSGADSLLGADGPFCADGGPDADRVLGFASLAPVSRRACYRGVAEATVYVGAASRRAGVGLALLEALVLCSEAHGVWTLQGATFAENRASLAMQERCGFRVVGRRERIARLDGAWRDTILTERRSRVVE